MIKIEKIPKEEIPKFWMHEVSGRMKQIVSKFFEKKQLTPSELKVLKEYIIQWIEKTANNMRYLVSEEEFEHYLKTGVPKDYKKQIEVCSQDQIMDYVTEELLNYGLDPF